jgi:ABC-2 type transport system permease protein
MKEIKTLYLVNAKEFLRDRMAVFLVLLLPIALAAFFGMMFDGGDDGWTLSLGLVLEDTGSGGQQFLDELEASAAQNVLDLHTGTRAEMLAGLNEGDVNLVLVLPEGMTASLGAARLVTIQVFFDSTQPNSAGAGLSTVRSLLGEVNLALSGAPHLLVMEAEDVRTNPLRSIDLFMPGLLGIALLWLGLFGTALPLLQQRQAQVLRRLALTPLLPATMLTAQVAWRVTVGLLQAALFLLVGYLAFKVGIEGNKLLFVGAVTLGALLFVSLGYLLAGLASSEEGMMAMVQMVNFPLMFLSGGLFPVESLPVFLKPVMNALPLTYLIDALKQIMVNAPPLYPLWLDFAVLGGWLAVLLALAIKCWRWE